MERQRPQYTVLYSTLERITCMSAAVQSVMVAEHHHLVLQLVKRDEAALANGPRGQPQEAGTFGVPSRVHKAVKRGKLNKEWEPKQSDKLMDENPVVLTQPHDIGQRWKRFFQSLMHGYSTTMQALMEADRIAAAKRRKAVAAVPRVPQ